MSPSMFRGASRNNTWGRPLSGIPERTKSERSSHCTMLTRDGQEHVGHSVSYAEKLDKSSAHRGAATLHPGG